mmetsp:Transcript_10216/g.21633  ORF Transcript_10216/g.21633 Transcript_10216/m.21633 type:complete len:172 (+) Transcript_10216:65-580(+)
MATMWELPAPSIYPSVDGWTPPALTSNEDMLKYTEEVDAFPKKVLAKRFILVREPTMQKLMDPTSMKDNKYSISAIPLASWSKHSGDDEDKGYLVWIYYQVADERKTLEGLEGKGIDLSAKERVAVDPDSQEEEEQIMMYCKQESIHMSKWEFQLLESGEEPKMQPSDAYW